MIFEYKGRKEVPYGWRIRINLNGIKTYKVFTYNSVKTESDKHRYTNKSEAKKAAMEYIENYYLDHGPRLGQEVTWTSGTSGLKEKKGAVIEIVHRKKDIRKNLKKYIGKYVFKTTILLSDYRVVSNYLTYIILVDEGSGKNGHKRKRLYVPQASMLRYKNNE